MGTDQTHVDMDLEKVSVRELNEFLHHGLQQSKVRHVRVLNPDGRHNLAVGVDYPVEINIEGHAGYFIAGMNKQAQITVHGNVGWSVAENMMSGKVRVCGNASECAGASGHGGTLIIEGDASSRCAISLKGSDVVIGGSVGHLSAFMAQAGRLVVCGDAGAGLGDSLYEAVIYVRGGLHGLGADAREEKMASEDLEVVAGLLKEAGFSHNPREFKRIASARSLYHWNADAHQEY